jgi:alcohol dehydrogenase class IV
MNLKGSLFMSPERVIFGRGVVDDIGTYVKQLGGIKPFIATDKIISTITAFQRIEDSLHSQPGTIGSTLPASV